MKKLFHPSIFLEIVFIFLCSLTPLFWFTNNSILVGHDNVFPLEPKVFLTGRLYSWIDQGFGQSQSLIMGTIPIHFIDSIGYLLGFSIQTDQKLVYIFWFFLIGLSAYILAHTIKPSSRYFKIIAAIYYQFNFFVLQGWFIGERTKFSALIAFPLLLASYYRVYDKRFSLSTAVGINVLILFIFNAGGLFGISLYGGLLLGLFLFLLFFSLLSFKERRYQIIFNFFIVTVYTAIGFVLINSYYILPALKQITGTYKAGLSTVGGVAGVIDWASEISANTSFINLLRLQGFSEWYDNPFHPYGKYFLSNPLLVAISYIWLIIILTTFIYISKKENGRIIFFFFLLFLIGIFFSAGTHPPLGFIYALFIKYIPGFIAFRSPFYKFAPAIFISASFLIAFFIENFNNKTKKVLFTGILLLIFFYHFPFFTGDIFRWRDNFGTRNQIPSYVYDFGKWIETRKNNPGRVLLLPELNTGWQFDMYSWGFLSLQTLPTLVTNREIVVNNNKLTDTERDLTLLMYQAISREDLTLVNRLSNLLNIKYYLIRNDFISTVSWARTTSPDDYQMHLAHLSIPKIKTFGKWDLYENVKTEPLLFRSTNNFSIVQLGDKQIDDYFSLDNTDDFITHNTVNNLKNDKSTSFSYSNVSFPKCINCTLDFNKTVDIPERNILPDSLLYPIVLWKEQRQTPSDFQQNYYCLLGLSLKRAVELKGMILKDKTITRPIIDRYIKILKQLSSGFNVLKTDDDIQAIAIDTENYIGSEHLLFSLLLTQHGLRGLTTSELQPLFNAFLEVEKTIESKLVRIDPDSQQRFQAKIQEEGNYDVLINTSNIDAIVQANQTISFAIDNSKNTISTREIITQSGAWQLLQNVHFNPGLHEITLNMPEPPNVSKGLSLDSDPPSINKNNICFATDISNFDSKRAYRMKLKYALVNNNSFVIYVRKVIGQNKILTDYQEMSKPNRWNTIEKLLYSSPEVGGYIIDVCADNLNTEIVKQNFQIQINEIIQPSIALVQKFPLNTNTDSITYKKIDPTSYKVAISNVTHPTILLFNERFDQNWDLSQFSSNHFMMNGYANAWLIDKLGDYELTLLYKPQNQFYNGTIISLGTFAFCIILLIRSYLKNRK